MDKWSAKTHKIIDAVMVGMEYGHIMSIKEIEADHRDEFIYAISSRIDQVLLNQFRNDWDEVINFRTELGIPDEDEVGKAIIITLRQKRRKIDKQVKKGKDDFLDEYDIQEEIKL